MTASKKERNYYIDNLKILLMLLVVIGHFSLHFSWEPVINRLCKLIYTFHMPCFVFVSGYLAKGVNKNGKFRAEKVLSFAWLYVVFKLAIAFVRGCSGGEFETSMFHVNQAPWYLFSMCVWYLLIPFIERMKEKWMIFFSLVLGVLVGYSNIVGVRFGMSRNFVFLLFFAMGFYLTEENLNRFLQNRKLKICSIVILAAAVYLYLFRYQWLKPFLGIIYGAKPYAKIGSLPSRAMGGPMRLLWYIVAIVLSMAVMQLIPRRKMWFSKFGGRTLQIYILHVLVRNVLVYTGAIAWCKNLPGVVNIILVWGGSACLVVLLGNVYFEKIFDALGGVKIFKKFLKGEEDKN